MEASTQISITLIFLFLFHSLRGLHSATFTIVNKCSYPVWPGILSGAGTEQLATTGFDLQPGESNDVSVPTAWSGRIWGRTLCSTDSTGKFSCITGDCGSSKVECTGSGAIPPATLAEFTLNGAGGMDFYDVSLVDGYNLPMLVEPHGSGGNCETAGCSVDLNGLCPTELKVKVAVEGEASGDEKSVACKSACEAFGDPQYCCSGAYATPQTCKPSSYSQFFKSACPRAYSYAYDDGSSTFTCASADYLITFCPIHSNSSIKSGNGKFPFGVDIWAGHDRGHADAPTNMMALVISTVLMTIWWQLS
ncbi:Thaumatin-like protein 1 [Trifolium repens]|nr:Thaumatin-like protein 1 [Trifolium repens]